MVTLSVAVARSVSVALSVPESAAAAEARRAGIPRSLRLMTAATTAAGAGTTSIIRLSNCKVRQHTRRRRLSLRTRQRRAYQRAPNRSLVSRRDDFGLARRGLFGGSAGRHQRLHIVTR